MLRDPVEAATNLREAREVMQLFKSEFAGEIEASARLRERVPFFENKMNEVEATIAQRRPVRRSESGSEDGTERSSDGDSDQTSGEEHDEGRSEQGAASNIPSSPLLFESDAMSAEAAPPDNEVDAASQAQIQSPSPLEPSSESDSSASAVVASQDTRAVVISQPQT